MIKKAIKRLVLAKRMSQSIDEIAKKSSRIMNKLLITPEYVHSKTILFYVSSEKEAYTIDIIKKALIEKKRVVVPIVDLEKKELELSEIKSLEELVPGAYGILEPKKEFVRHVGKEEIQLAIVPGIAFDLKGNRIGYGHGYYDKLLAYVKCTKIALAFDFQIVPEIREEKHDIKIDRIITEIDVINIK